MILDTACERLDLVDCVIGARGWYPRGYWFWRWPRILLDIACLNGMRDVCGWVFRLGLLNEVWASSSVG